MFHLYEEFVGAEKPPNRFWSLTEEEIVDAERRLGFRFPKELREFFSQIGCGFFSKGKKDKKWDRSLINGIVAPAEIVDLILNPENPARPTEGFLPGLMPFFDLGENSYLVLRPKSAKPSCVYWPNGKSVVSEDLKSFFRSLYDEAGFYLKT